MTETHPFGNFVPKNAKYLILGSFPGKPDYTYNWFYSNRRNQFWTILKAVYKTKLDTKEEKQKHFGKLRIAITDIILSCDRHKGTNSDTNLTNITYNTKAINKILKRNKIEKIFFTSRFAEKLFRSKCHPELISGYILVTLPSPSPRYAKLNLSDKINIYKKLLPH